MRLPNRADLIIGLALALMAAALWVPTGFNVGFTVDGWAQYSVIDYHIRAGGGALLVTTPLRPLFLIPYQAGYALTPNAFIGYNIVLLGLMIAKGWLAAAVLHRLTRNRALAAAGGVLLLLFPADAALFYEGALTLHMALALWLLATLALLIFIERGRFARLIISALALLIGLGQYEIVFLFVPVAVAAAAHRGLNRRFWVGASVVGGMAAFMGVRYLGVALASQGNAISYQVSLLDANATPAAIINAIGTVYANHFWNGWLGPWAPAYAALALAIGIGAAVLIGGMALRPAATSRPIARIRPARWIIIGLAIILVGVALYLPTRDRASNLRTYYFSAVGAAVALSGAAWGLSAAAGRRQPLMFAGLVGALALIGGWRLLEQHAGFAARAQAQGRALAQFVEQAPAFTAPSLVVIIEGGEALRAIFDTAFAMRSAFEVVYQTDATPVVLCGEIVDSTLTAQCVFGPRRVVASFDRRPFANIAYDQVLAYRFDAETGFTLLDDLSAHAEATPGYAPRARIDANAPPPVRAALMLPPP